MTIHVEGVSPHDEHEALALMVHHLKLAARYFEATPEEISVSVIADEFSFPAIAAWIKEMEGLYPNED